VRPLRSSYGRHAEGGLSEPRAPCRTGWAELIMDFTIGTRDGLDYFVIVVTVVAAVAAIAAAIAVLGIFQQFRRRPELRIGWEHESQPWPSTKALAIPVGSRCRVRVSLTNVGDAGSDTSMATVVLATPFELVEIDQTRAKSKAKAKGRCSSNSVAGFLPDHSVTVLASERHFYVGSSWTVDFEIRSTEFPLSEVPPPGDYKLLIDFSDDRLNRTGRRIKWLRSLSTVGFENELIAVRAYPEGSVVDIGRRSDHRIVRALPDLSEGTSGLVDL